jgi:hypothetical protein
MTYEHWKNWPGVPGVSVNPELSDGGDIRLTANLHPSTNYPCGRVIVWEAHETAPRDEDGNPEPRVSMGLTAKQARALAAQLVEMADAVDAACPGHDYSEARS